VSRWNGPALHSELVEFLHRCGLAYTPQERRGVVLVVPMDPQLQSLPYIVVDSSPADASVTEAKLADALGFDVPAQVTS
jgi:hypothetical protein